jgi:hypothetical protein
MYNQQYQMNMNQVSSMNNMMNQNVNMNMNMGGMNMNMGGMNMNMGANGMGMNMNMGGGMNMNMGGNNMNMGMSNMGMSNMGGSNMNMGTSNMNLGLNNQGTVQPMGSMATPITGKSTQNYQQIPQKSNIQSSSPMGGNSDGLLNYCEDPFQILSNVNRAYIYQEIDEWEEAVGCDQKNAYNVCVEDPITQMQYYLFRCKEDSSYCQRCCCSGASQAFSMRVKHISANYAFGEGYNNYFAELIRSFKCTCCCCRSPDVTITLKEGNIDLGTIQESSSCFSPVLEVYGPSDLGKKDNALRHVVYIDCCQPTYLCYSCTCGKLQELECGIYDGKDKDRIRKTGRLMKKVSVKEFFSKANVFCIDFPENASAIDRLNLIFCGLFIDYRLFENDVSKDDKNNTKKMMNVKAGVKSGKIMK